LPVQVNGKIRTKIQVPPDSTEEFVMSNAMSDPKVIASIEGKTIVKSFLVPGRLVNIVVK